MDELWCGREAAIVVSVEEKLEGLLGEPVRGYIVLCRDLEVTLIDRVGVPYAVMPVVRGNPFWLTEIEAAPHLSAKKIRPIRPTEYSEEQREEWELMYKPQQEILYEAQHNNKEEQTWQ